MSLDNIVSTWFDIGIFRVWNAWTQMGAIERILYNCWWRRENWILLNAIAFHFISRPHSVMNAFYSQLIYWSSNLIIWNFRYSDLCWQWVSFLGGELIISSLIMQRKYHQRTICGKGQVKVVILSFALIFYPRFSIKVQQRERPKTKLPILSQCFESTHLIMDSERVVVELLG